MPDLASLTFSIDSSQARAAIATLTALKDTSVAVTSAAQQQQQATGQLFQSYNTARDQIDRLAQATRVYDGTLQGLILRLTAARDMMTSSQTAFSQYNKLVTEAAGIGITFNTTIDALDRYAGKARELRIQQSDLTTGLTNITAALQNQTAAGNAARIALEQLGVSLAGIGPNQPQRALQAVAEQLRGFQSNQYTLRAAQQVFGPGFDANALQSLQSQPYIPARQRQQEDTQQALKARIDALNASSQRLEAANSQRNDERHDLASQYSQDPTVTGRLGINLLSGIQRFFTQSRKEQFDALKKIEQLPPDQREAYTGYGKQIGDFFNTGFAGQTYNRLFSGDYSAGLRNIGNLYDEERNNGASVFTASLNYIPRWFQNLPGVNAPVGNTADRGAKTPFQELQERREGAEALGAVGDNAPSQLVLAQEQLRQLNTDPMRKRYIDLYGADEGTRRFNNEVARQQQSVTYQQHPEQELTDDTRRQQVINALPFDQRAEATALLQGAARFGGRAAANVRVGSTLEDLRNNVALSSDQNQASQTGFRQGVTTTLQQSSEETQRQIEFQQNLTKALEGGRAAAEDYTRAWTSYIEAKRLGATDDEASAQALGALNVAMAQRITQGKAMVQQLKDENDQRQAQIDLARRNADADPVARRVQELTLGINQQIASQQRAGTLPNESGEFRGPDGRLIKAVAPPEAGTLIQQARETAQTQIVQQGEQGAIGIRSQAADALHDQTQILGIMHEQGVTLERATEIYRTHQQFNERIAQAAGDITGKAQENVAAQERATQEYQRQLDITKNIADNLDKARQSAQSAATEQALQGVPAWMRAFLREGAPSLFQTSQAGAGNAFQVNNLTGLKNVGQNAAFRSFETQEQSITASVQQFQLNSSRGLTTLSQLVHRWADPDPGADQEAQYIAQQTGIGLNDPVNTSDPAVMNRIMFYLSKRESGRDIDPGVVARGTSMAFGGRPVTPVAVSQGAERPGGAPTPVSATAPAPVAPTPAAGSPDAILQGVANPGAFIRRVFTEFSAGQEGNLSELHLPRDQEDALRASLKQLWHRVVEGQKTSIQEAADQQAAEIERLRRQRGLAGQPGQQQLVVTRNPNLIPGLQGQDAANRRQLVTEEQRLQSANLLAGGEQSLQDEGRRLAALQGPLAGYATRLREVSAALQAESEQRQYNLTNQEKEQRQRQLLTEAILKQREALQEENRALANQNELGERLNAAGPFASQSQQRRIAAETQLQQYARENPDVVGTPEFAEKVNQVNRQQTIADQAEQMRDLREAAHGAYGAIEQALSAVIVRGEKGRDAMKELGMAFKELFLRDVVFKPLEKLGDMALSSIFGSGEQAVPGSPISPVPGANTHGGGLFGNLFSSGATANDNSDTNNKVADAAAGVLGIGSRTQTRNGLPIDTAANAMRVVMVNGTGTAADGLGGGSGGPGNGPGGGAGSGSDGDAGSGSGAGSDSGGGAAAPYKPDIGFKPDSQGIDPGADATKIWNAGVSKGLADVAHGGPGSTNIQPYLSSFRHVVPGEDYATPRDYTRQTDTYTSGDPTVIVPGRAPDSGPRHMPTQDDITAQRDVIQQRLAKYGYPPARASDLTDGTVASTMTNLPGQEPLWPDWAKDYLARHPNENAGLRPGIDTPTNATYEESNLKNKGLNPNQPVGVGYANVIPRGALAEHYGQAWLDDQDRQREAQHVSDSQFNADLLGQQQAREAQPGYVPSFFHTDPATGASSAVPAPPGFTPDTTGGYVDNGRFDVPQPANDITPTTGANDNSQQSWAGAIGAISNLASSVVGTMHHATGGPGNPNRLPIDPAANAMRVMVINGSSAGGGSSGGGILGSLFGGNGSTTGGGTTGSTTGGGTSATGPGLFARATDSVFGKGTYQGSLLDKLFGGSGSSTGGGSGSGSGSSDSGLLGKLGDLFKNYPQNAIDGLFGKGFYQGGGLIGSLFGGGDAPGTSGGANGGSDLVNPDGGVVEPPIPPDAPDITPNAMGGVYPANDLSAYANQVIDQPTHFRFARGAAMRRFASGGVGLMGEAGSEAIMPLSRGADGRLGVAHHNGSSGPQVVFNISTPDADSFRRSQPQINARAAAAVGRTTQRNAI